MALETTYTITAKTTGTITFKFDLNGNLTHCNYVGEPFKEKQKKWFYPRLPLHESGMKMWQCIKEFTVVKGLPDISFDNFWTTYDLKTKKTKAEELFNKLNDDDKFNAIAGIKKYNNWLRKQNGIAKQLPDTYLRQKRWLDEF